LLSALCALLIGASAASAQVASSASAQVDGYVTDNVQIPTRVHQLMAAAVSFPTSQGRRLPGPFPVILTYSPYCGATAATQALWTSHEYVYAYVNMPGTCESEGRWTLYQKPADEAGYDIVEWLAAQSWSTGRVGMVGTSAAGISQLHVAAEQPPHLVTINPTTGAMSIYNTFSPGGIPSTVDIPAAQAVSTASMYAPGVYGKPQKSPEAAQHMIETGDEVSPDQLNAVLLLTHPLKDEWWTSREVNPADIKVPMFVMDNWDDFYTADATLQYAATSNPNNRLTMGGGGHAEPGPQYDITGQRVEWMDYWLKGVANGEKQKIATAPIDYYGLGADRWQTAKQWPPSRNTLTLRAASGPSATGADGLLTAGRADNGSSQYAYVPGASTSVSQDGFAGGVAQLDQHGTATALTFATAPLDRDTEVTGEPTVNLRAATNAHDTDWVVRVLDIAPDGSVSSSDNRYGTWIFTTKGQLRASHRASHSYLVPVPANEPVDYSITLRPISYLFKKGDRIGLQITSADPTRNLDTPYPALNTIYHGSSLILPLGPASR
jgi:putative CocE/NonD family hydrolase